LLRRISEELVSKPVWMQSEDMHDAAREDLLEEFTTSQQGLLCGVMGGVFAEGIDLPGKLVEAAIVVGVGIPQVNTENEMIRAYYDRLGHNGFEYAYLYPGMRRVVQSAGRVIRSEADKGIILLLDHRFAHESYQRLFPRHWYDKHRSELISPDWENELNEFLKAK
jgi:Rad3-related DNA helicase